MKEDDGTTLIETVIAMLVMSIAVVALVSALASMISLAEGHRGHAVSETAARSFGQAVQAMAESSASLVSDAGTKLTVADASTLPPAGSNSYLLVEREVVQVTAIDRTTGVLNVVRGAGNSTQVTHPAGTSVVPLLHCPSVADLTPPPSAYTVANGVSAVVSTVEYWQPSTSTWVGQSACLTNYQQYCPAPSLLPECSAGLFRVAVTISTAGDSRLKGIGTTTQVLVRTGSA